MFLRLTHPFVYIVKMLGFVWASGYHVRARGYSVAGVVAKAVFGIMFWAIASEKSKLEEQDALKSEIAEMHGRLMRTGEDRDYS